MKIVVCVKQTAAGELNPFDACALETALRMEGAEVTLLSMAPEKSKEMLLRLTRLGAKEAILLSDRAFAGADTLATAYTLSLAIRELNPDLVVCGRQTVDGDTAQTGPALAAALGYSLITNVMSVDGTEEDLTCTTRTGTETVPYPALITVERINTLRLPSIRSKPGTVMVKTAGDLGADVSRCGLQGSPTKVKKTFENESGKRKCRFISPEEFETVLQQARTKEFAETKRDSCGTYLKNVWIVGEDPRAFAETVSDDITVIEKDTPQAIADRAKREKPSVILWGSNPWSKRTAPQVAWLLQTGLCADCTLLETDGKDLFMYRPAFSGNIIAKIVCTTLPQMATVRTAQPDAAEVIFAFGKGARDVIGKSEAFATCHGAVTAASRAAVDTDLMPYEKQIGLTGKSVAPKVYVAFGISGAVHHVAGMNRSGTVIAVNSDKDAPIFDYADFGIVTDVNTIIQ